MAKKARSATIAMRVRSWFRAASRSWALLSFSRQAMPMAPCRRAQQLLRDVVQQEVPQTTWCQSGTRDSQQSAGCTGARYVRRVPQQLSDGVQQLR